MLCGSFCVRLSITCRNDSVQSGSWVRMMSKIWIVYGLILSGSILMGFNIICYVRFERYAKQLGSWEKERRLLHLPIALLALFLCGYLLVLFFGKPDLLVALILFGGSIFVFIMVHVMWGVMKRIEENGKLKAQLDAAREASNAKTMFLSNMSHDIRTPLNAIIGYAEIGAGKEVSHQKAGEYLMKIRSSGEQLASLINDILEMSRIESGKMELHEEPADLGALMDSIRDLFELQMAEKGLAFAVQTFVSSRFVIMDRNRMNRVLQNLVSNACKFTPEGGRVDVTLSQTGTDEDRGIYEFRVKDTGIGMTEDFSEKIFEAFERERSSTVSGIQGTGLGMAITKNIVDLMGGKIGIRTAPGEGTEFTVTVTFRICDGTCEERLKKNTPAAGLDGMRVLLAEDMEINREIATAILSGFGVETESVNNGREAVERILERPQGYYDAVLMDIQMPVMDGYEAAKAIRSLKDPVRSATPIIAMTANAFEEDRKNAAKCGMNGHVSKPIDIEALKSALADIRNTAP